MAGKGAADEVPGHPRHRVVHAVESPPGWRLAAEVKP